MSKNDITDRLANALEDVLYSAQDDVGTKECREAVRALWAAGRTDVKSKDFWQCDGMNKERKLIKRKSDGKTM